jgi:hypothetical protein
VNIPRRGDVCRFKMNGKHVRPPWVIAALAMSHAACVTGTVSGKIDYSGTTPVGAFAGSATVEYCRAHLRPAGVMDAIFILNPHRFIFGHSSAALSFDGPLGAGTSESENGETLLFSTESGLYWSLSREQCAVFEVRQWLDEQKQLHASIHIDCTTPDNAHIRGTAQSDSCNYLKP